MCQFQFIVHSVCELTALPPAWADAKFMCNTQFFQADNDRKAQYREPDRLVCVERRCVGRAGRGTGGRARRTRTHRPARPAASAERARPAERAQRLAAAGGPQAPPGLTIQPLDLGV